MTPEERELAARLARIGPHGEPSAALDARILNAAQAAAARSPGAKRRRWPAWAGIAATLALALGAVWQLRPVPEVPVVLEETGPAPVPAPSAQLLRERPDPIAPPPAEAAAKHIAPPPPRSMSAPKPSPVIAPPEPRAVQAPPVVFDDPSPVDVPAPAPAPAPTPAPPPPPPAPPAQERADRGTQAAMAARSSGARSAAQPVPAEASAAKSQPPESDIGATLTVSDLPVDSDRQLRPLDWIERIRQRRDAGDLDGARASLAWLQLDHPGLVLPDDLRAIAPPSGQ
jgi:hypothetical protein